MPSREHELFTDLIRQEPALAPELLAQMPEIKIPPDHQARLGSPDLSQCVPTEYRADAVVELTGPDGGMAIVVEVQRAQDDKKRWSWPVYLATLRSRLQQPTVLLVMCPDDRTARWSRMPIDMGHPGWELTPLAIGPSELRPITDPERIAEHPELTILAALGHPGDDQAIRSISDALETLDKKEKDNAKLYLDYAFATLSEAGRKRLEELMATSTYEYKSDFARGYFAAGEARGEARSLLRLLDKRGVEVPEDTREKILGCTDLAQLDTWFERAVTAASVDELFN